MRISILVAVLLITSTFAVSDKSKFRDQLSSLMNMQSRAVDAVIIILSVVVVRFVFFLMFFSLLHFQSQLFELLLLFSHEKIE